MLEKTKIIISERFLFWNIQTISDYRTMLPYDKDTKIYVFDAFNQAEATRIAAFELGSYVFICSSGGSMYIANILFEIIRMRNLKVHFICEVSSAALYLLAKLSLIKYPLVYVDANTMLFNHDAVFGCSSSNINQFAAELKMNESIGSDFEITISEFLSGHFRSAEQLINSFNGYSLNYLELFHSRTSESCDRCGRDRTDYESEVQRKDEQKGLFICSDCANDLKHGRNIRTRWFNDAAKLNEAPLENNSTSDLVSNGGKLVDELGIYKEMKNG